MFYYYYLDFCLNISYFENRSMNNICEVRTIMASGRTGRVPSNFGQLFKNILYCTISVR